jgi:nucleotide-binding universal stress UspA family protein
MTYKSILVYVNGSRHTAKRVEIAAKLALQHNAHLIGTAATALPPEFYMPGAFGGNNTALSAYLDFTRETARTALAAFEASARQAGVTSIEQRLIDDEAGYALSLQARYCDLVVIGQTDPDETSADTRADMPEYVVMNSCRPVLLVPYAGRFDTFGKRILIAWDGSTEATRAVTAAIPLLARAETVQVALFNPKVGRDAHGERPGADIALYLARHGVQVEVSPQATPEELDTGNALLSHSADFGADLIVMGCYGHSRFREILLGGVTHTLFKSMVVPTLMAH